MLYRSTDRLCRCGASVENLTHSASFHSGEKTAPSKPGIKHLAGSATALCGWNLLTRYKLLQVLADL
jgi:hypothetical protein